MLSALLIWIEFLLSWTSALPGHRCWAALNKFTRSRPDLISLLIVNYSSCCCSCWGDLFKKRTTIKLYNKLKSWSWGFTNSAFAACAFSSSARLHLGSGTFYHHIWLTSYVFCHRFNKHLKNSSLHCCIELTLRHYRRTLRGEGHTAAGWGIGGLVCIAADCGSKVRLFGQWAAANCAALPTANAGQYATSHSKPLLFWFPCKLWYIMSGPLTFNVSSDNCNFVDFQLTRPNVAFPTVYY